MLRPSTLSRGPASTTGPISSRTVVLPSYVALPRALEHPHPQPHLPCESPAPRNSICHARRKEARPDVADMDLEQRLERLDQLSGRVGELDSVYSKEQLLQQMGVADPALYAAEREGEDEEEEEDMSNEPLIWFDWNDDPRTHVGMNSKLEVLPDGLRRRLVAAKEVEEGETLIQVPIHNCLVLHFCEADMEDPELLDDVARLEREDAAEVFENMQMEFLDKWTRHHGAMPSALVSLLCDFTREAPTAATKMALWLLWVAEGPGCEQRTYWRDALGALPQPPDMPNVEFASEEEMFELQWLPYSLPAGVRKGNLANFYADFGASPLAAMLGFRPEGCDDPDAVIAEARAEEAEAEEEYDSAVRHLAERKGIAVPQEGTLTPAQARVAMAAIAASKGDEAKVAAAAAAAEAAKEVEEGPAEAMERLLAPRASEGELRPLPSFERFLWAYCHAGARSVGSGERLVFIPQAEPCIYTPDPEAVNTTLEIVTDPESGLMEQWAVLAAERALPAGTPLLAPPPFAAMPIGGGGSTSQLHCMFGELSEPGGNTADIFDFEPRTGDIEDMWLKVLLGQGAAASLESVTDPYLKHMLGLLRSGEEVDVDQIPPVEKLLPKLQLPKLWGPGLISGVKSVQLVEFKVEAAPEYQEALKQAVYAEEEAAAAAAAVRGVEQPPAPGYREYEEWRQRPEATEIEELPGDPDLLETEEGRARWRRLLAAWNSLPRVSPDTREHGRCMENAVEGKPLQQCFTQHRDIVRELGAAESLLASLTSVLTKLPTTIQQDEALLASAAAPGCTPRLAAPATATTTTAAAAATATKESPSSSSPSAAPSSDPESDASASSSAEAEAEAWAPCTAVTTRRMLGIVAWRLEFKRVWQEMVGLMEEYRDALQKAVSEPEQVQGEGEGQQQEEEGVVETSQS